MNGVVNIYKPRGLSSFDVVRRVKKIYNTKHVGHLGTLDPLAEGVLTIAVGKATKLFDYYLNKDKEYIATFKVGEETDTLDLEGEVIKTSDKKISVGDVKTTLPKFIGEIMQTPPKYSAIKINGKRAYELARKDIDFEIKPKKIRVDELTILSIKDNFYEIKIVCSAGTYIRSLGRDIFNEIGSCATMVKLVRTRAGNFDLKTAVALEDIEAEPQKYLVPLKQVLSDLLVFEAEPKYKKQLINGVRIKNSSQFKEGEKFLLMCDDEIFGIAEVKDDKIILNVNLYKGE